MINQDKFKTTSITSNGLNRVPDTREVGTTRLVLATGLGNPPAVWVLTGGSVQFGSRPGQKPDPHCLGGFVTRTGHKLAVFWPGFTSSRASLWRTQNFGSN
jgi:hypothetical protein